MAASRLLLIDDEPDVLYSFRRLFEGPELEVITATSGEEGLRLISQVRPDLVVMDIRMTGLSGLETLRRMRQMDPKLLVVLMTAYGTTQTAIEAMKLGAYDYLLKPFDVPKLRAVIQQGLKAARDMRQTVALRPAGWNEEDTLGLVGRSEPMQQVFKLIGQLAGSDATVLITGESGTGKELVARAIYQHSRRSDQPFLAVNCAAIPEGLLESELFGHERGAFTGATQQRIGKFEQCHRGTLFLDEIGDMSLTTQAKILRVLQSGQFERLGGNQTLQVDVRILAATNRPLEQMVAARQFREDLFYRLNVVRIHLPPLRERKEDIPLLVEYFLGRIAREQRQAPKSVTAAALEALMRYDWPGNVRELENLLRRASVIAKGDAILPTDLPPELAGGGVVRAKVAFETQPAAPAPPDESNSKRETEEVVELARRLFQWARRHPDHKVLPAVERELVVQALKETGDNQVQAAKLLGITRATLRKRIEKFGIRRQLRVE
ncbi:MAG: sigma-54 dependent transcriptional regulator [Verrucomicrobiota bacterium]|nr:sigma-54 dependent transcriptional regulator [Limisphaera sp.]MDW8382416.1 sigma-54 dependent transcriptional regulator [Verrucomicrobiota bacterium]